MKHHKDRFVEVPYLPDDYFESTSLKKAVWQYLIDHAKPANRGDYRIYFFIKDEEEFWIRVNARKNGHFKRNNLLAMRDKALHEQRRYEQLTTEYSNIMRSRFKLFIYRLLLKF